MGKIYPTGLLISPEIEHNMSMFAATAKLMMAVPYPASFDWRKTSDGDYTTPIRDQAQCGSCVAFATVALMESVLEIAKKNPQVTAGSLRGLSLPERRRKLCNRRSVCEDAPGCRVRSM